MSCFVSNSPAEFARGTRKSHAVKCWLVFLSLLAASALVAAPKPPVRGTLSAPRIYKNIPWKLFQEDVAEQIAQMYVVHGNEWIQVRQWVTTFDQMQSAKSQYEKWRSFTPYSANPETSPTFVVNPELPYTLAKTPKAITIPQHFECTIHETLQGREVRARLLKEGSDRAWMATLAFPATIPLPEVDENLSLWLVPSRQEVGVLSSYVPTTTTLPRYQVVPEEEAIAYHTPTATEAGKALRAGKHFVVKMRTFEEVCPVCNGSKIDERRLRAAEAAIQQTAPTSHRHLGVESAAYAKAKLMRDKPACQTCNGTGKVHMEEFRELIYAKPR